MRKPDVNLLINVAAFILFIMLASTGLLLWLVLPAGHGYLTVWGMNRHAWGDIHFWIAVSFFATIAIHLVLHWNWIKTMMFATKKKPLTVRNKIVILLIILASVAAAAPFFSSVEGTKGEGGGQNQTEIRN